MELSYKRKYPPLLILIVIIIGATSILGMYRLISGRSLGLRSWGEGIFNQVKVLWTGPAIKRQSTGDYRNIVFLHHSTGNNLVQQGKLKDLFEQSGYQLWDHYRNAQGLRGPDGTIYRMNYQIPGDNTDPDGLATLFMQKSYPLPINALSALLQHEVIIVKSCFEPANNISSENQLKMYKNIYLGIRDTMDAHPDRIFIFMTTPPLNPAATNPSEAERARRYAEWLGSKEFLEGHPNIFVFDFFDLLAEGDPSKPDFNMLRSDYRDGDDSHPNKSANEQIAPIFADFVIEKIEGYRSGME